MQNGPVGLPQISVQRTDATLETRANKHRKLVLTPVTTVWSRVRVLPGFGVE
jgi:hypothetical protein